RMPKFAANLSLMFSEVPFLERFERAARAGFRGVEFLRAYDHPPEAIAEALQASGLKNVLFNMPSGDWNAGERGLSAVLGREEEFRESVATAMRYAKVLGTPCIHVLAGIVPPDGDRARCRQLYIQNLCYAARQLATIGSTLVIEPINPRDMPGYLLSTQAEAHAIREEVGEPNLKVQMDFYHAQIVEGDLATKLRRYLPNVAHIQIAGVPDRHEPDEGEVNYRYLFRLLDELGYQGWVGCEYRPRGVTEDGLRWLQAFA
ncbi:MAG: 2-oxo-tetronate isomerase, partial [Candidatus Korobacteraceae bacterium]